MRRDEVIEHLKQHERALRALGAASLYLYGSHARSEAREDSDVDLFFDRDPNRRISLMELIELKFLAEQILGTEVDIGTRTSLHPVFKPEIERSALRVFECQSDRTLPGSMTFSRASISFAGLRPA